MNYLTKINDYYYLTSYMGKNAVYDTDYNSKFIRAKSIEDICAGNYEELNEKFNFSGTPYFISYFDEKYYITEIDGENGIYSFEVEGDKIKNINYLFKWETVSDVSKARKFDVLGK